MIILSLVLIGVVITLEPLPLTAFILVLASKSGGRKGAAFIFGWLFLQVIRHSLAKLFSLPGEAVSIGVLRSVSLDFPTRLRRRPCLAQSR
jgi:hypothetical protein